MIWKSRAEPHNRKDNNDRDKDTSGLKGVLGQVLRPGSALLCQVPCFLALYIGVLPRSDFGVSQPQAGTACRASASGGATYTTTSTKHGGMYHSCSALAALFGDCVEQVSTRWPGGPEPKVLEISSRE